jgi:hypothetical protein
MSDELITAENKTQRLTRRQVGATVVRSVVISMLSLIICFAAEVGVLIVLGAVAGHLRTREYLIPGLLYLLTAGTLTPIIGYLITVVGQASKGPSAHQKLQIFMLTSLSVSFCLALALIGKGIFINILLLLEAGLFIGQYFAYRVLTEKITGRPDLLFSKRRLKWLSRS